MPDAIDSLRHKVSYNVTFGPDQCLIRGQSR